MNTMNSIKGLGSPMGQKPGENGRIRGFSASLFPLGHHRKILWQVHWIWKCSTFI